MRIRITLCCMLLSVLTLAAICYAFQNRLDETTVKAQEPVVSAALRIVEAEKCYGGQETGCQTTGSWKKPWQDSQFSNGWLITNEHSETWGLPLPATLTLTYTGTGVGIVYRQDTWYGTLGVKLDDQPQYHISQRGAVKNQAEACFEVETGPIHTLTLSAGQPTGLITGVITVDAMKIFDQDEPCGAQESLCDRGIIVPAYFSPDLPDGYWGQLVSAAKRIDGELIVIANVYNGPGTQPLITYTEAISAVASNGGKVIGYVHTCWNGRIPPPHELCPKTEDSIKADVITWYTFYPVDGIFFDEVSWHEDDVSFYQRLHEHVQKQRSGAIVVFNSGVEPHQSYSGIGSSILCTFENQFSYFVGWSPPSWITRGRSCALVHNTSGDNLPIALEHLSRENIGWSYFTSDTTTLDNNPWDTLPPYFPGLVDEVDVPCTAYLPVVLKGYP
jgi:hypothetical protein